MNNWHNVLRAINMASGLYSRPCYSLQRASSNSSTKPNWRNLQASKTSRTLPRKQFLFPRPWSEYRLSTLLLYKPTLKEQSKVNRAASRPNDNTTYSLDRHQNPNLGKRPEHGTARASQRGSVYPSKHVAEQRATCSPTDTF